MTTFACLFSGGGGATLGAQAAGLTPLWGVEFDPAIAAVYRANIGPDLIAADVADVDYSLLPVPDVLHASPVCTNASQAKSGGAESESDLLAAGSVCRALRALVPRFFTLENVIPYRSFQSYRMICSTLTDLGYLWHAEHCNAADFGVPQTRRRLILRASRDGLLRGLPQAERWVGWYEAIEDLIPTLPESRFAPWQLARLPQEVEQTFLVDQQNGSRDSTMRGLSEPAFTMTQYSTKHPLPRAFICDGQANDHGDSMTVRDASEPMMTVSASGSKRAARAFLMRSQNTGQGGGNQVRYEDDPAMTITQEEKPRAWLDTGRVVKMTPRTLARFQSFPDSYGLPSQPSLACKVIGNACPPLMMQRIFESLL